MKLSNYIQHYIGTALWSTSGNEVIEYLDGACSFDDVPLEFIEKSKTELDQFFKKAEHLFTERELEDMGLIAHNFWLTRAGHGAGFWEGDYENGDAITEICKEFKDPSDELRDSLKLPREEAS